VAGHGTERTSTSERPPSRAIVDTLIFGSFLCLLSSFLSPIALDTRHNVATTRQPYAPFSSPFRPPFVHLQSYYTFRITGTPEVAANTHLSFPFSLACLSVLGSRPVEPLSTRSRPGISFPSRFPLSLFPYCLFHASWRSPMITKKSSG
jgi:hypothetical protein